MRSNRNQPTLPVSVKKRLIPAILAYSQKEAKQKLSFVEREYPHAWLHVDAMDGKFVSARCWCKPASFEKLAIRHPFEVHLMAAHPERHVAAWKRAGAQRIVFHIEATDDSQAVIATARSHHMEVVVALNPSTPLSRIRLIIPLVDGIMLMGVVPGYAGQPFIPSVYQKAVSAKKMAPKTPLSIDGGVTTKNASRLITAGAQSLVSTSAVYGTAFSAEKK